MIVNNLDDLESKYPDHPRTAYVKVAKKGKFVKGKTAKAAPKTTKAKATTTKAKTTKVKKPRNVATNKLSKELEFIVGSPEMSRTEATKKLWDYIKLHNLQDPKNKRSIIPDAPLAKVFGSNEPVDMFKLAGILNKHFLK